LDALLGLGHCARLRGDRATALTRFQAAATAHPTHLSPQLEIAKEHRDQRRAEEAEAIYQTVLAASPNQLDALLGLGHCARLRGDRATALTRFQAAATAHPTHLSPQLEIAEEHRDQGAFEDAIEVVEIMSSSYPADPRIWVSIGLTHRRAGRLEEALGALHRALSIAPANADILAETAVQERALGRPHLCRERLEQALRIDPDHPRTLTQLADLANVEYAFDDAVAILRTAISAHPSRLGPWIALVRILTGLGRHDEALSLLRDYTSKFGGTPETDAQNATILNAMGSRDSALDLTRSAARRAPWNFAIWDQKFRLEWAINGQDAAAACLDDAPIRTTHDSARLSYFRGRLAEERWQLSTAIEHYNDALTLNARDVTVHSDLARACLLSLDIEGARQHLRAVADIGSSSLILQGRSPNISQTHLGQLLDDFVIDRQALAAVVSLNQMPPEKRILGLLNTIIEAPDYTAAAVLLCISLRQAGHLDKATLCDGGNQSPIPKRIVQYWDNTNIPEELISISNTWRDKNQDYEYTLFDNAKALRFLQDHYSHDVARAYLRAPEAAQKADIFRLAYLLVKGGYYADMDDRCLKPLDEFLSQQASFVCYQENLGTIGNNFIATVPLEQIIERALNAAVSAVNRGDNDILWLSTGPGLLTRALAQTLAQPHLNWNTRLRRISVLHWHEFSAGVGAHSRTMYKKTERHWSNTALGRRSNARFQKKGSDLLSV
jgi:tetratricopeptide (TPR) repeat protein